MVNSLKLELLGISIFSFILIAVLTIILLKYFFLLKRLDLNLKWIQFSCRSMTILLLVILILDPWVNWKEINYLKQDLNVYLDNSKSIAFADSTIDFNSKINFLNDWANNENIKINWYLFGDSIREFNYKEVLFNDKYSSVKDLKKNIVLDQKSNHLIVTDGHINRGERLEDLIIDNNNIYISGVGNDINDTDCYISSIQTNDNKNKGYVDLLISLGCIVDDKKAINLDFILTNSKNNIIKKDKMVVDFNKSSFQDISLTNISRQELTAFNTLTVETNLEELNYRNNSKNFIVDKQQNNGRLLFITGGISANTRFIKKVIKDKFPNLEVVHNFQNKKIDYELLDEYSLIILDNFPFSSKNLKDYYYILDYHSQIPIVYFQGPGLPIEIADNIAQKLDLNLVLSDNKNANVGLVNNHILFNEIDFNKIPPTNKNIFWITDSVENEPVTYFDNQSIAAFKGEKKSAVFISNLASSNLMESNLFNTSNVVDYTYSIILNEYELESKLINLDIDSEEYSVGSLINTCIDINEKIIDSDFYINIYDLEGNFYKEILLGSKIPNDCNYTFSINEFGKYYIQVLSKTGNSVFQSNKEYLDISDFDIELEFLYQNKKSIHNFKNNNDAISFDFKNLEENLSKVKSNLIVDVKQSSFSSLSTQYYWILLIIFLALEWYLRKKNKLL